MVKRLVDLHGLFEPPERPLRNLNVQEIECYARERVIHVSGVLSDEWLQLIGSVVDELTQSGGLQSMAANAWHTNDAMHRIIMTCPVAHLAQQLLDHITPAGDPEPSGAFKPIRFFYDQMFVKHPKDHVESGSWESLTDARGHLGNTPWHQDITFWPVSGDQIVSIWIALDRTDPSNGGLEFVPGSSDFLDRYEAVGVGDNGRIQFASNTLKSLPRINSVTSGESGADLSSISFDMEAGDILIFDSKILHGAPPNVSDRPRRGLALRYLGSDVVLDDAKYGEGTVMAPFDCYDDSLVNGDSVRGYAYPQILPVKVASEIERRLDGPLSPSHEKMGRWLERNKALSEDQKIS